MALFVSIVGTALSATEAKRSREDTADARKKQEQRNEARRAEEDKERTQASFRQLGRRKRREAAKGKRPTILTGSQLGGGSQSGKTLIGE